MTRTGTLRRQGPGAPGMRVGRPACCSRPGASYPLAQRDRCPGADLERLAHLQRFADLRFSLSKEITLGGWLGAPCSGILRHVAAAVNGLIYLGLNLATGRLRARSGLTPAKSSRTCWPRCAGASARRPEHYNAVQKAAYLGASRAHPGGAVRNWRMEVVQFPVLRELMAALTTRASFTFFAMAACAVPPRARGDGRLGTQDAALMILAARQTMLFGDFHEH